MSISTAYEKWTSVSLMLRIVIALVAGAVLALVFPNIPFLSDLGTLFIGALKAIAPVLVFCLIVAVLSKSRAKLGNQFKTVILLYIVSTVLAAIIAVVLNFTFPETVTLVTYQGDLKPPKDFGALVTSLVNNLVQNPVLSITSGNYLGILFWSIIFGFLLKKYGRTETIDIAQDLSDLVTRAIRIIIEFAPVGIFGIIYAAISENGLSIFTEYGALILLLVASMLIVMFITNPLMVAVATHRNPYPLLFRCLRVSAVNAFFTRSSAANIPVNMKLAEDLGLDKEFYSVSIPLGATINMAGAAITISTMTIVCANTVGQEVPIFMAIILCILSAIGACGASGVPGGSLLLIPLACSLFGIDNAIAMEMVAVGYIIGVIQDSMETALNSSSDILFTAAADLRENPDLELRL